MPESVATESLIRQALKEDLANQTDITTTLTVPDYKTATAVICTRIEGTLAGISIALKTFKMVDKNLTITLHAKDGNFLKSDQDILSIKGNAASIMIAERTALNFLTHLSGIATLTKRYVNAVKHTNTQILDTRKTIPGLRVLQKYAVKTGGGVNHRFGLYDAILIKDNHIAIAGGINNALDCVKGQSIKIEIEVDTLEQLDMVLKHGGADIVMLDNMDIKTLQLAVDMAKGKIITEASGGITLDNVLDIAKTGVDYISIGALTHSAQALDIGLDINIDI
ncbi:MAG: carboxylating nicotinate-nucleotide diphosphorylase [Alphaproteobacteria bacterium]|nr:carboxylating nicotinate-nucleotide diphosphorylase [Alphaproteobacteria bacterium]